MTIRNHSGFTLLELLVVITIIFSILLISYPIFNTVRENVSLSNQAYELVNILRLAQNRSITSQDGTVHGVHFNSSDYIIFGGDWTAPNYTNTFSLGSGIQIIAGSGGETIFNRLTGDTTNHSITLGLPGGKQKIIQIDSIGKISIIN